MKNLELNDPTADLSDETQLPEAQSNRLIYVETTVHGRDETGLTIVGRSGKGEFFPDQTAVPPLYRSKQVQQGDPNFTSRNITTNSLYPHWESGTADAGIAIHLVSQALEDLNSAAESPQRNETDIMNYIVLAETQLFQALEKARFNKAFEIVVRFCAWAVRNAQFGMSESPPIQGVCAALRELQEQPFLSIDRATTLISELQKQGWADTSTITNAFQQGLSAFYEAEQEHAAE